ncbi:uncharacterized protein LOC130676941 [Microplitis mediator]|uniref:uncharacterized protein LOC130676941 n=1 Tax=Microplitis mediator TaxID=375433 RepID=UPI0025563B33|nr:uncharacterized protein LOC130676941 [Microplitis mediator]
MGIDIFGRVSSQSNQTQFKGCSSGVGPPGKGFKLTNDGQFDLDQKRLCNVAEPKNESDAVTYNAMKAAINHMDDKYKTHPDLIVELKTKVSALEGSLSDLILYSQQQSNQYLNLKNMENKKKVIAQELHKPARKNYTRRHVDIRGLDETWQADLVEMIPYSSVNSGFKYLLTVIDIFSKYAWAVPIKSKKAGDVRNAMKSVLQQGRHPKNLHVDQGKEFYNKEFKDLMKSHKIHLYSTFSNLKASICERFNRTLKNKMWQGFTAQGSYRWIDMLRNLVDTYNNTKHRTIKMKPIDVTVENEKELFKKIYKPLQINQPLNKKKSKFKVGDKVRINKYKHVFEKGYTPNWTTEIFTIKSVQNTNPTTYKLIDYQNQSIEGGFYNEELSKVKYPDVYLVEKIVKRRGGKYFVKWLGFDSSHNSWVDESDL